MTHLYATHDGRGAQVVRTEEDEIYGDYFYSELYRRPAISRTMYVGTLKDNYQNMLKFLGIDESEEVCDQDEVPL